VSGTKAADPPPDDPAPIETRRGTPEVVATAASLALILGFLYLVYGYVFANGLCCADDASIAVAAKNLALGHGYGTSVPYQGGGGIRLFDPLLSTGPVLVVPAAVLIRLFGVTPWAPGLATAIATTALLLAVGVAIAQKKGVARAASYLAVMLTIQYTLTAGSRFVHWYALLGEVPAAMLTIAAAAVFTWGSMGRRTVALSFLLLGLAFMTKALALLGALPLGLLLVVLVASEDRERGRRRWSHLAIGAASFAAPAVLFELWKLLALGPAQYLDTVEELGGFFTSTGGASDAAPIWERAAANSAIMTDAFGFGPLPLVVAVGGLAWVMRRYADRRARGFFLLLLTSGAAHLLWYVVLSIGNPRYAIIGLLLLAAAAACVALTTPPTISAVCGVCLVLLAIIPARSVVLEPVDAARDGELYRPSERVRRLEATADALADLDDGRPFVGGWWATVVDLEYMLPTVSNFVRVEEVDPREMRRGRYLVRNDAFVRFAPAPLFTTWEEACDDVVVRARPYLVTRCPGNGR
jgi:hypothetical protein